MMGFLARSLSTTSFRCFLTHTHLLFRKQPDAHNLARESLLPPCEALALMHSESMGRQRQTVRWR